MPAWARSSVARPSNAGAGIGAAVGLLGGALIGDQMQARQQQEQDVQRQITAQQAEIDRQAERAYSAMHQNVLDVFNEHGVQIMTPAYEGDPEKPKVVPKEQWYQAPATSAHAPTNDRQKP